MTDKTNFRYVHENFIIHKNSRSPVITFAMKQATNL